MEKKTKIVATVSDLRCDVDFIKSLVDAGTNVVRLNTAHQTLEDTLRIVENVRKVSENIALIVDTKGPEIRTSATDFKYEVKRGDTVKIMGDATEKTNESVVYVNHPNFVNEVDLCEKILIDDGELELLIVDKKDDYLLCKAKNTGVIKGKKSVNVPNASFSLPALTAKDREYIHFAIEHDIDFIAHSFVRNKQDVMEIREILDSKNSRVKIIAKIENQEGVDNIDEILEYVYGVMVARGDLAIEIPYEKIPGIQKRIINKCIEVRKPVIIATQMLHSMIKSPRPTRAEVTDIANAIYSKTDAVMLSGETAYGDFPVESVETMATIIKEVEKSRGDYHKTPITVLSSKTSAYLAKSAVEASIKLDAKVIIADTSSGRTIRNISGFRGRQPVYCQCYDKRVMRELALSFGVYSNYLESNATYEFVRESLEQLISKNVINQDDRVVVIGGNYGIRHGASFIEISEVSNLKKQYKS
ncbi:MAG: pyruvate kinase [Bacteroidales bacterium]|nr:pyruvate kinase [Bacteroidales bacterium]MBN2817893.1 pyruvate kinase [Bacteroidales bacterium]